MGIFHFKGVFKEQTEDGRFLYVFYPDYVAEAEIWGVFAINPNDWQPVILVEANAEMKGLVSTDQRCVSGLTAKLKMHFETAGQMPSEVVRILSEIIQSDCETGKAKINDAISYSNRS